MKGGIEKSVLLWYEPDWWIQLLYLHSGSAACPHLYYEPSSCIYPGSDHISSTTSFCCQYLLYAVKAYAVARCLIPEEPPPCAAKKPPMRALLSQPGTGFAAVSHFYGNGTLIPWAITVAAFSTIQTIVSVLETCTHLKMIGLAPQKIPVGGSTSTSLERLTWKKLWQGRPTHLIFVRLYCQLTNTMLVTTLTQDVTDATFLWTQTGEIHTCTNFLEPNTQSAARYMARCVNLLRSWCPSTLQ